MNPNKFDQVIEELKKQGHTDEQIVQFCQAVTEAGYNQIYTEGMALFTEVDMNQIEACETQEQANGLIRKIFEERTGQKVEDRLEKYIEVFSENFLREIQKPQPA